MSSLRSISSSISSFRGPEGTSPTPGRRPGGPSVPAQPRRYSWPGALHFSCMLFGYPVVVVHDAPLYPISLRLLPYASQNPRAVHCEALLTTLCLKRQVITKRRVYSYVPRPADDRLEHLRPVCSQVLGRSKANLVELRACELRRTPSRRSSQNFPPTRLGE